MHVHTHAAPTMDGECSHKPTHAQHQQDVQNLSRTEDASVKPNMALSKEDLIKLEEENNSLRAISKYLMQERQVNRRPPTVSLAFIRCACPFVVAMFSNVCHHNFLVCCVCFCAF